MLPRVNVIATEIGQYLLMATQDLISTRLLLQGTWEPWHLSISQLLLEGIDTPHVVDVGANLGAYAIPVARQIAGRRGTLTAFEAQRVVHLQLCGNVFLNRLDNVYPQQLAIGDRDGEIELPLADYGREINIGALSIDPEIRRQQRQTSSIDGNSQSETVPLRRLDALQLAPVALLKIDVEGCELEVLQGAHGTLEQNTWPPILFELWDEVQCPWFGAKRNETLGAFARLGYRVETFGQTALALHPHHPRQFRLQAEAGGNVRLTRHQ